MAPRFGRAGAGREPSGLRAVDLGLQQLEAGRAPAAVAPHARSKQVTGLLGSVVGLIVFAVFAYRAGMDMWWVLLVVGVPLIQPVHESCGAAGMVTPLSRREEIVLATEVHGRMHDGPNGAVSRNDPGRGRAARQGPGGLTDRRRDQHRPYRSGPRRARPRAQRRGDRRARGAVRPHRVVGAQ